MESNNFDSTASRCGRDIVQSAAVPIVLSDCWAWHLVHHPLECRCFLAHAHTMTCRFDASPTPRRMVRLLFPLLVGSQSVRCCTHRQRQAQLSALCSSSFRIRWSEKDE